MGQSKGNRRAHFHSRVWFDGQERYRIESSMEFGRTDTIRSYACEVGNGKHVFAVEVLPGHEDRAKWHAVPSSWMPGLLETYLLRRWPLDNPKLMGVEQVHGLRAEHWREVSPGNGGPVTREVWMSKDPRLPIVLRWQSKSAKAHSIWQITKLDIESPVPGYMFTPQLHPRGGIVPILTSLYRPPYMMLALRTLLLCCYGGIALALTRKRSRGNFGLGIVSVIGIALSLFAGIEWNGYIQQLSDTWIWLVHALLAAGFLMLMWRKTGPPGDVSIFKGTKWSAAVFVIVAAALGLVCQGTYEFATARFLGLRLDHLPFLPATLLNVVIVMAAGTAVEELVFRGYLYGALQRKLRDPQWIVMIQAFIFSLYHMPKYLGQHTDPRRLVMNLLILVLYGFAFGLLRWKYKNLGVPWLVHTAYNVALYYVGAASGLSYIRAIGRL